MWRILYAAVLQHFQSVRSREPDETAAEGVRVAGGMQRHASVPNMGDMDEEVGAWFGVLPSGLLCGLQNTCPPLVMGVSCCALPLLPGATCTVRQLLHWFKRTPSPNLPLTIY